MTGPLLLQDLQEQLSKIRQDGATTELQLQDSQDRLDANVRPLESKLQHTQRVMEQFKQANLSFRLPPLDDWLACGDY